MADSTVVRQAAVSSAVVRSEGAAKSTREFIGRGWINQVQKSADPKKIGMEFINVQLDKGKNGIEQITLTNSPTLRIQLWPNNKRPDHPKDADYRVSIVS